MRVCVCVCLCFKGNEHHIYVCVLLYLFFNNMSLASTDDDMVPCVFVCVFVFVLEERKIIHVSCRICLFFILDLLRR